MKKSIILTALIFGIGLFSCKTTIPVNDSITPTLTVMISGDGLNYSDLTLNDPDFDTKAFRLKRDVTYNILFSGKDRGGVKEITFNSPLASIMEFPEGIPSNWTETTTSIGIPTEREFKTTGDPSDPRSSLVFGSSFILRIEANDVTSENRTLSFEVIDFHDNTLNKTLLLEIGPGPTGIIAR